MQQGRYLTLFLHKQPQTGLGLHSREGFAPCPTGTLGVLSPNWWSWPQGCFGVAKRSLQRSRGTALRLGMSMQLIVCALCCLQDPSSSSSFWSIYRCLCWRTGSGFAPRVHHLTVHGAGMPAASRGQNQGEASEATAVSSATQPRACPSPAAPPGLPTGAVGPAAVSCPGTALPRRGKLPFQPVREGLKAWRGGSTERLCTPGEVKVQVCSQSPSTPGSPQGSLTGVGRCCPQFWGACSRMPCPCDPPLQQGICQG